MLNFQDLKLNLGAELRIAAGTQQVEQTMVCIAFLHISKTCQCLIHVTHCGLVTSCEAKPTAEAAAGFSNPPVPVLSFTCWEQFHGGKGNAEVIWGFPEMEVPPNHPF